MATYNDGTLPFGSQTLQIPGTTGDTFVAESITFDEPEQWFPQYDEVGAPSGGVSTDDHRTGTATLQIPTGTPALPDRGDQFGLTIDGSTIQCWVSSVSIPEEHQGLKKVSITFREKLN